MKLDRADRQARVDESLDGSIVQIPMTDHESAIPRQAVAVDLKFVVLGGDGHPTGAQVHHRVVPTVVAELETRGAGPRCLADQLMPKTDAEHGQALHERPGHRHRRLQLCRITGSIR